MQSHGPLKSAVQAIAHQCGLLGCRVGEASNPGPVQTRQARRLERSPGRDGEHAGGISEEILDRPNRGRHVVPRDFDWWVSWARNHSSSIAAGLSSQQG